MTAEQVVWIIVTAAVLLAVYESLLPKIRCSYCGADGGHKPECPWNLDREERS